MIYKRIFICMRIVAFQVGVNVIGLPDFHQHKHAIYKNQLVKR